MFDPPTAEVVEDSGFSWDYGPTYSNGETTVSYDSSGEQHVEYSGE